MPGADLTPARLEQLLAAATPRPWFVVEDDRPGMEWNRHICWDQHGDHRIAFMASDAGTEANAALIALSPALAARVIELEAEVERLREAAEVLEQVSAAQTRLVYEGIDRGKGHWPAWDDVARAVTAARDLAAKIKGDG